ncbi:hypothetical protein GE061_000911 [Apolygus lucorum]|uniref:Ciliogenesis and planar polarity effector 2 n=1 Tax=Apolygus lucorum TaxID=248454 RepID=A0A6A4KGE7_APOLU|nr:hypothetical protein GE061_000911 [Apolygus lucorum]
MDTKSDVKTTAVIQRDWHSTPEGDDFFKKFSSPAGRRLYGVLERPVIFDGIEEVTYKVLFIGKCGVGKSHTISHLAGLYCGYTKTDTIGIEVTDVYWPVKIWDKVIIFKLQCWEAGESSMKKYNHIVESCQDKVDLRVFVFSYTDTSSFTDLPAYISSTSDKDMSQVAASIVIGTRNGSKAVVSPSEIKNFKMSYGIEVYSLPQAYSGKMAESIPEIHPLMNDICEILWLRDQHYIMNNSVTV